MKNTVAVKIVDNRWFKELPAIEELCAVVVSGTLANVPQIASLIEVSVLLTQNKAVKQLNRHYRGLNTATNVLSFPLLEGPLSDVDADTRIPLILGDVVLAFETVRSEANSQHKRFADHVSHLLVHGILHLLGYEHIDPNEAETMEQLEETVLEGLGIRNPYLVN